MTAHTLFIVLLGGQQHNYFQGIGIGPLEKTCLSPAWSANPLRVNGARVLPLVLPLLHFLHHPGFHSRGEGGGGSRRGGVYVTMLLFCVWCCQQGLRLMDAAKRLAFDGVLKRGGRIYFLAFFSMASTLFLGNQSMQPTDATNRCNQSMQLINRCN